MDETTFSIIEALRDAEEAGRSPGDACYVLVPGGVTTSPCLRTALTLTGSRMPARPWRASLDGVEITWRPRALHVSGDPVLLAFLEGRLSFGDRIAVTPTGPFIEADVAQPIPNKRHV